MSRRSFRKKSKVKKSEVRQLQLLLLANLYCSNVTDHFHLGVAYAV